MMKKITVSVLLALSFSAVAAPTASQPDAVKVMPAGTTVEPARALEIPETVTTIHFKGDHAAVRRILTEVEKHGFTTATANLAMPEAGKNNVAVVFSASKEGNKLTPQIVSASVRKHAQWEWSVQQQGVMSAPDYFMTNGTSMTVNNVATQKFDDGRVTLTQFVSIARSGKQTASFDRLTLDNNGAIINILRPTAGEYYLTLTTLN